jgi:demethylmenaquinone methyltransferase/2-methoxy-6-polyprenyl-1,4-benzoquinol methylase
LAVSALPEAHKKAVVVEAMFDRIAARYDLVNRLLTFQLDQRWRWRAVRLAGIGAADRVVDLGCGTGDLVEIAAAAGARVVGVDFSAGMLAAARRRGIRPPLVRANAAALPMAGNVATAVISAFALRNFTSIPAVLREAARVLVPGGRLVLLEVDEPGNALLRWGHALYFRRLVPLIGGWLSDRPAYAYLPQSTAYLPPERDLLAVVREAGFTNVAKHRLHGGVAQLLTGVRG